MTTHDHDTEMTGSYDQAQNLSGATEYGSQHRAPVESTGPSTASAQPPSSSAPTAAVGEEHRESPASVPTAEAAPTSGGSAPGGEAPPVAAQPSQHESSTEQSLFADDELAGFRAQWTGVQAAFVDDPRECVQKADALVSGLVEQLTSGFARARSRLEEQWARGEEASTEDLRVALMHYREFFERLLAV